MSSSELPLSSPPPSSNSPAPVPAPAPESSSSPSSSPLGKASQRGFLARPGMATLLLVGLALLVLLPGLERAGLWDPHEVRLIEGASEPMGPAQLWRPEHAFKPRLPLLPVALGLRTFGINELGARLPMVLVSLLSLLSLLSLGGMLDQKRTGRLAGLVLLTTPLFFLSARQVSLVPVPVLGHILTVAGLVGLCWPRPDRRVQDLLLGAVFSAVGLGVALLSAGSVVGVAAPVLAVGIALSIAGGPVVSQYLLGLLAGVALLLPTWTMLVASNAPPTARLWIGGAATGLGLLAAIAGRGRRGLWIGALSFGLGLLFKTPPPLQSAYSPLWAGLPHFPPNRETQIDTLIKPLGFFLFPWSALVPLAIATLFGLRRRPDPEAAAATGTAGEAVSAGAAISSQPAALLDARAQFAQLLPLSWFVVTYVFATAQCGLVGDSSFPGLGALALLVGGYIDRLTARDGEPGHGPASALAGLCAALFAVILGHDLFFAPEQLVSAHLTETLRWPAPLTWVGQALTVAGLVAGAVFGLAAALPSLRWRRRLWAAGGATALLLTLGTVHGLIPAVSKHVSYRGIYTKYKQLGGGALGMYGVPQSGSKIYGQSAVMLNTIAELLEFLNKDPSKRAFVIVGAGELAGIDLQARSRNQTYYVVDDSNVQFLLLASRLLPGETDLNPLRRLISEQAPMPQHPMHVTFEDKFELIGYDMPPEVTRGEEFTLRLYYRVLQPITSSFKIFVHFDGSGARWNADHLPLDGKFPTNFWAPGRYITDEHHVTTSRMGQSAGYYQVFTGLWPGGDGVRLKVTAGDHEPDNRVRLGAIRVK